MKEIRITSQSQFDKINSVESGDHLIVESSVKLSANLIVYGRLTLNSTVDTSWGRHVVARGQAHVVAWEQAHVEARGQAHVVARGQAHVEAWEQAHVVARGQAHVVAWEQAHVVARGQAHVEAWEQAHVEARGQAHVEARGQAHVEAWEQAHVVARGQAHVVAWEQAHVEAWEQAHVEARGQAHVEAREHTTTQVQSDDAVVLLFSFAIAVIAKAIKHRITKKSKTAHIQTWEPEPYLTREGIAVKAGTVILFKRVSSEFLTQEGKPWETKWTPGVTRTHPAWSPYGSECGQHKYHACSRPYFCDEFRSKTDDQYVAIQIAVKDLYEWPNPHYPHKIAFRKGKVLYRCDRYGNKIADGK